MAKHHTALSGTAGTAATEYHMKDCSAKHGQAPHWPSHHNTANGSIDCIYSIATMQHSVVRVLYLHLFPANNDILKLHLQLLQALTVPP